MLATCPGGPTADVALVVRDLVRDRGCRLYYYATSQEVQFASAIERPPPSSKAPATRWSSRRSARAPARRCARASATGRSPAAPGSRHDLAELDAVRVGRGGTVSAAHARLERDDTGWTIVDEGSKNDTFVNGERVSRAALRDGDLLEIGPTLLVYRAALATPSAAAPDLDSAALAALTPGLATLLQRLTEQLAALERLVRDGKHAAERGSAGDDSVG